MIEEDIRNVLTEVRELRQMVDRLLSAQKPPKKKKNMTVREASEYTTLAEQTIRLFVKREEIPFKKLGRRVVFNPDEIDQWMDDHAIETLDTVSDKVYSRLKPIKDLGYGAG